MTTVDDDFLDNKSYSENKMVLFAAMFIFVICILVFVWYAWINWGDDRKKIYSIGGLCVSVLIFVPAIIILFMKLRNIPTHLDIRKDKIRIRYNWGEEIFGTNEVLCYVGSKKKRAFASKIQGAVLKDGSIVHLDVLDEDFAEDFLALAKKNKTPLKKNWSMAKTMVK
jgi:magnesium-transporting ATPase (P-type)